MFGKGRSIQKLLEGDLTKLLSIMIKQTRFFFLLPVGPGSIFSRLSLRDDIGSVVSRDAPQR